MHDNNKNKNKHDIQFLLTYVGWSWDRETTSEGHMSGKVRSVRGAGIEHIANADRVNLLRFETNALHGSIGS